MKTGRSEQAASAQHDQEVFLQQVEAAIDSLIKKQLDREVPFDKIPEHQIAEYAVAEAKEWDTWIKTECVTVLSQAETKKVRETTHRSRIIRLRYVYRDKTRVYGHHKSVYP